MTIGDRVTWYSDRGWRYGTLVALGWKWAKVLRAGRVLRVERKLLRKYQ